MRKKQTSQSIEKHPRCVPVLREIESISPASRRRLRRQRASAPTSPHASEKLAKFKQKTADITELENTRGTEALVQEATATIRTMLIAEARSLLARGTKANIKAGQAYNELKPMFPHGEWVPFLKNEAARFGLSFRTLQEFMRMARESDALVKKEKSASSEQADDPQAKAITNANETAKATRAKREEQLPSAVNSQSTRSTNSHRKAGIYRLPLSLTGQQKLYLDALRDLPNWPDVELAIVTNLEKLFVIFGVFNDPAEPELQNNGEFGTATTVNGLQTDLNSETAIDAAQV